MRLPRRLTLAPIALAALALAAIATPTPARAWEGAGLPLPGATADVARQSPAGGAAPAEALEVVPPATEAPAVEPPATEPLATEPQAATPLVAEPGVAVPATRAAVPEPRFIEEPLFRLAIPFRTQKDGGRWQTSNCGPAALGMVLDGFGIEGQATDDLRFRAHTYQGTVGMRTGTAMEHIARVAEDLGLTTHGLYASEGRFRAWTVDDVRAELRAGRPVMPLVRLYLVPGYEGHAPRWGHYILLTGLAPDGFSFSDSLKTEPDAGTGGVIAAAQLERAMAASHIPGQAVAFGGPAGAALALRTPLR